MNFYGIFNRILIHRDYMMGHITRASGGFLLARSLQGAREHLKEIEKCLDEMEKELPAKDFSKLDLE